MSHSLFLAPGSEPASATEPCAAAPNRTSDDGTRLALTFDGKTADYFRIWIVNLCLTLLTFGVFSAWAKVRKKRFFYAHTRLDGTPFEYRGRPLPILKGRLVALVVAVLWTHLRQEPAWLTLPFMGLVLVALPWVIVRTASFHARSTAYRNLSFDFSASYGEALKLTLAGTFVTLATLGLGFALWRHRLTRFLVQHTRYGGVRATFSATSKPFVRAYAGGLWRALAVFSVLVLVLFLRWLRPSVLLEGFAVAAYFGCASAFVYAQTRLRNALWDNTTLGPLRFAARLRARDVWWIYVTNAAAIVLSLGLLVPWAELRMLRYRASRFRVHLDGSLAEFGASQPSLPSAVAAEITDLLALDVSL